MGGDHAPRVVVEGAVLAAREYGYPLVLVGREEALKQELSKYGVAGLPVEILPAVEVVGMDEQPSAVLRQKRGSSLIKAVELVKKGEAQAVISAGNTGAMMAAATLIIGRIPGVERPGIAALLPSLKGYSLMLDAGANVHCKPNHLLQFAVMGYCYAQKVLKIERPNVGLLNIGEERTKGNKLTKQTLELLEGANINFIGNVEGSEVYNGKTDVVVCDGFTGNISLKISEAVAETIMIFLRREFERNWKTKLGYLLLKPSLRRIKQRIDYSEYGGAPLLGVAGACIICHGSSSAKAIKNAIRVAAEYAGSGIYQHIEKNLALCHATV